MITGNMARSNVVHIGRFIKEREGFKLHEPICMKMQPYRSVTYLWVTGQPVTCKKCQAKADKYPHLFKKD